MGVNDLEKQAQRWHEQTLYLGVRWHSLLISDKSCKFLQPAIDKIKFRFLKCDALANSILSNIVNQITVATVENF